jgi:hypothetical protein
MNNTPILKQKIKDNIINPLPERQGIQKNGKVIGQYCQGNGLLGRRLVGSGLPQPS